MGHCRCDITVTVRGVHERNRRWSVEWPAQFRIHTQASGGQDSNSDYSDFQVHFTVTVHAVCCNARLRLS